jgi:hypothetical protein
LTTLCCFAAVQVSQATLPFGQPAMVYDPLTYTWTAPFKQLMRVRLLLNSAEVAQVCPQRGEQWIARSREMVPPFASRRQLT